MPVFKTFFKISKKYFISSIMYVAIFVGVCIGFSKVGGDSTEEYKVSTCKVVVFDNDKTEESQRLIDYLATIHTIYQDYEDDKEKLQDYLYYRKISYVLYIEEGFAENGKLSNIQREGTNVGAYIDSQISTYMSTYNAAKQAGYSDDDAYKLTLDALDGNELVSIQGDAPSKFNGIFYAYRYESYALLMVLLSVLGPILMAFNKKETKDRLEISAMTNKRRVTELFLGVTVVSIIIWAFFAIFEIILNNGIITDKEVLATVNALAFTICVASITNIIGNFSLNGGAMGMVTNVIGLGMCFLGGVFVPLEFFGSTLQSVAKIFPTYWYEMGLECIYGEASRSDYPVYIAVQLLFAAAFFAISLVVSKRIKMLQTA